MDFYDWVQFREEYRFLFAHLPGMTTILRPELWVSSSRVSYMDPATITNLFFVQNNQIQVAFIFLQERNFINVIKDFHINVNPFFTLNYLYCLCSHLI